MQSEQANLMPTQSPKNKNDLISSTNLKYGQGQQQREKGKKSERLLYVLFAITIFLLVKALLTLELPSQKIEQKQKLSKHQLNHKPRPLNKTPSNPELFPIINQTKSQNFNNLKSHPPHKEHIHILERSTQPTVGIPQANSYFNYKRVFLPGIRDYEVSLNSLFKPYNDTNCQHAIFGTEHDASYVLCKNFVNHSKAIFNMRLEGSDSFGCNITTQFELNNYIYDCSRLYSEEMCPGNNKMIYDNKCFGQKVETIQGIQFTTIEQQLERRKLKGQPIIMKIDIEGAQWSIFRFLKPQILQNIDQMVIEFHLPKSYSEQYVYWGNLDIIQTLKKHFVSVNLHLNNYSQQQWYIFVTEKRFYFSLGVEVTLVNRKLIKINQETRAYPQKVPNLSNDPNKKNMIMREY